MTGKNVLGMSTITYKFQITIPKKVREKYNLEEGDSIMFVEDGNSVYLKKSTEMS
ncbi:MAG: AbrB/MazE/SpoVT family DNA-binding domain-containing protein [Nitrosopumilaceae archaeon]|nr:AbrB/MazE/SpoVT family DNA-binding domain-containing protein [Nitrosopumilaceae archaeon]NIU02385.1 AbrB/MazE/SpoVT family DNA-binding domain-containing protein [Nitrosopumilaceae archaeon]NIU88842.1 AbrB/MazE/SpoVT family DNA-binding domain-containing protein [Nitrosopumilaceae archaeon]NIV66966.1 AbrB/MazE/SpoVT family DNA-binding domain-containing protein [Nitrosopumilaceae archaeon]NIX62986.1 AbrB/MazE/SpoVT family DNA-binding domain-containing protein [Nitrosopumilaceae archaeon]